MNDNWFAEREAARNVDVQEFKLGNSILIGLTDENIKELYSEFSQLSCCNWLMPDKAGRYKSNFLKWCTTAPIDNFRKG